jgi:hypothetical protein
MEPLPDEAELVVTHDKWSAPSVEFRLLDGRVIGTMGSWGGKRDPENPTLDFDPEYQVSQQDRDAMVSLYDQHLRWFLEDENAWLMALGEEAGRGIASVRNGKRVGGSRGIVRRGWTRRSVVWFKELSSGLTLMVDRDMFLSPFVSAHFGRRRIAVLGCATQRGKRNLRNPTFELDSDSQVSGEDHEAMLSLYHQHFSWFFEDNEAWLQECKRVRS